MNLNDSTTENYADKIKANEALLADFKREFEELAGRYGEAKKEEDLARGNIDQLLKVAKKKRKIKEGLEQIQKCMQDIEHHKQKLEKTRDYRAQQAEILERLKIDVEKVRAKRSPHLLDPNPYHDRIPDRERLNQIKQGIVLGSNEKPRGKPCVNYGIDDQKYNVRKIVRMQREKAVDVELRRLQVLTRQKRIVEKAEDRALRMKILKKHGLASNANTALYPDLLTDSMLQPFYELRLLLESQQKEHHSSHHQAHRSRSNDPQLKGLFQEDHHGRSHTLDNDLSLMHMDGQNRLE